ncbi:tumor necrosis factor receptor superfamily member 3-like [Nematolebias whitei]|uniref:tumor necrosis factor receptor superfamily member 3-like n=1 Tax=Nematolebias whitei TaxID=451745 RepID=UPI001898E5DF|nr:tumor necrosis factor receptor superfamily member 3-like [Nematolebias whitei]
MTQLGVSVAFFFVCLLSSWTVAQTTSCGASQIMIDQRCCNMCPPGTFMGKFCSEKGQTICSPCTEGSYSDKYNIFDRCEPCQTCQQGYGKKCTKTTKGTCSCRSGFLCSNSLCSACEENKCIKGENLIRTNVSSDPQLVEYSYHCEPKCTGNQYFDLQQDTCKQRTQCNTHGFVEQFPGNTTHDSVCFKPEKDKGEFTEIILCIGFVLFSLTLFILVSIICSKIIKKHAAKKKPIQAVVNKTSDFHLSKEESGLHLIVQDEAKNMNSFLHLDLDQVSTLS